METTQPSRDVWGSFNGPMANSFLVNLNELSKLETTQSEGKIKGLVTDPTLSINNKGVNQFEITSYHRFLITTNNEDPITTRKDDRRNLIIRSSDEKIGDKIYFNDLHEYINNQDIVKTCFEYFINLDGLNSFNTIKVPIVEYQQDMQEASISPIEAWLKDFIFENRNRKTVKLTSKELFGMFNLWCTESNVSYDLTLIQFGVRIKRMKYKGIESDRSNKGIIKIFNMSKLKKEFKIDVDDYMQIDDDVDDFIPHRKFVN
jgi:phage/plasmid-associated DNA primase